jgi:hypothetical protein
MPRTATFEVPTAQEERAETAALIRRLHPEQFKEGAGELECDNDDARLEERVGKLVKHKLVEKPE